MEPQKYKTMPPDFTIITPSLNYGRFLRDCLESVSSQAGVTTQHLVMDAGSSDDSAEIASGFPSVDFRQEPDKGMSDAINKGFDIAAGNWVMWLNADDRLKPGALAEMLEFSKKHPAADVVYGSFDFIGADGRFQRRMKLPNWSNFVSVHHCCYIPSTACFLRKQTILDDGYRLNEAFRYVMDGEFYARLHREGKRFAYLPVSLADFRMHGENASMRHRSGKGEMKEVLKSETQHVESRAIRRVYGITAFRDPYLNGIIDGFLYLTARGVKILLKLLQPRTLTPRATPSSSSEMQTNTTAK